MAAAAKRFSLQLRQMQQTLLYQESQLQCRGETLNYSSFCGILVKEYDRLRHPDRGTVGRDLCFWARPARECATAFCGTGKYGMVTGVRYGCAGAALST